MKKKYWIVLIICVLCYTMYRSVITSIEYQTIKVKQEILTENNNALNQRNEELTDVVYTLKVENNEMKDLVSSMVTDINKLRENQLDFADHDAIDLLKNINSTQYIAEDFIKAYIDNDTAKLTTFMSDKLYIEDDYIMYDDGENAYKVLSLGLNIDSYRLSGYNIIEEEMSYFYSLYEHPSRGVENGFFMYLTLVNENGMYMIDLISVDI